MTRWVRPISQGLPRLLSRRGPQFWVGFGVCAVVAVLMAVGFLRPRLFGAQMVMKGGVLTRTFNEQNMRRLSWFLTLGAFPIAGLGLAVVALRRWRAVSWVAVLPPLLVTPYLRGQRPLSPSVLCGGFAASCPEVLPGIILLMAIALAAALVLRIRRRPVLAPFALAAVALLVVIYLGQSLPLRHHNEYGGSFQVTAEMASVSGPAKGVYLFGQSRVLHHPGVHVRGCAVAGERRV